ncbi:hypothetical protein HC028_20105 [Planosporangium flavigriseum]|nr:hypothetical protein [Planosporangium flavigriseum]NJC66793.1 hypothetical protein [Planosporangium flavigriseum]
MRISDMVGDVASSLLWLESQSRQWPPPITSGTLGPMDRGMATMLALLGMIVGFFTGRAYQAAQRARADWKRTRATIPLLRRTFLNLFGSAAGWILIVGVVAAALIGWTVSGATAHHAPKPAATVQSTR